MHEYSIVEALFAQVDQQVRARGGGEVRRLHVRLGELCGVDPGLLATAYDTFRERSSCQSAELLLTEAPARWTCRRCGQDIAPGAVLRCRSCDRPAELAAGDEIVLERIELEVPNV